MKTYKEIGDMIIMLKTQRLAIPPRSMFGDDNHGSIDKQVRALQDCLTADEEDVEQWAIEDEDDHRHDAFTWVLGDGEELVEADDLFYKKGLAMKAAQEGK